MRGSSQTPLQDLHCQVADVLLCFIPITPCASAAVGRFSMSRADAVVPGAKLAVVTKDDDPSAGFTVVEVTKVEDVQAEGMYMPLFEHPYIIADGVASLL